MGRRDHDGMCRGAVAMKRTTAIGPAETNRELPQARQPWDESYKTFTAETGGGFIALVPIPKGKRGGMVPPAFDLGP